MATKTLAITFTNPRDGKTYEADVGPDLTTEDLVKSLTDVEFLRAIPTGQVCQFAIKRTGATIPEKTAIEAAGVVDGDTLIITLVGGAGGVSHV